MDSSRITMNFDDDFDNERVTLDFDDESDDERLTLDFDDHEMESRKNFSLPIDQSHLDRLPDLDDFDGDDCDSEAEYSYGEDSLSLNEGEDDLSLCSDDDDAFFWSSLFTITEETEEDLLFESSLDEEEDDTMNDDSDCRIQMPRPVSLDAYLAKDERRHKAGNLDVTNHPTTSDDSENSELSADSLNIESIFLRRVESVLSFAQDDDDIKSVDSSSTAGSNISFRLAQRKLQKELCLIKLKQAFEAAELSSSFRKDDGKTSKCIGSLEQLLLKSKDDSQARKNLLSAISSSTVAFTVQKE